MMASVETSNILNTEDDSFIILGSSPGTSLDLKFHELGIHGSLTEIQIEEVMKLRAAKNASYNARLKHTDGPSPASLMAASTIINEGTSTEDLQKHYGQILDENLILKDTLKQNNDSMTEQLMLISACQEDMLKTHSLHKAKFEETKLLVEKLRQENKQLKQELVRVTEAELEASQYKSSSSNRSDPSSAVEFVTSPDDDVVNKLTAQLGLVEKQRREVIVEKETLTWQKESLESVLDAVTKERDELQEKVLELQMLLNSKGKEYEREIIELRAKLKDLQQSKEALSMASSENANSGDSAKLETTLNFDDEKIGSSKSMSSSTETINVYKTQIQDLNNRVKQAQISNILSQEEKSQRDAVAGRLEDKVASLQNELKDAKLKILELESVKMECSQHKSTLSETVKMYKDQIQDLNSRLKVAQTTVFQPAPVPKSPNSETPGGVTLTADVKKYDETLKQLANMLNSLVEGSSDCFVQLLGSISSLYDYKLDRSSADTFKTHLYDAKTLLAKQHSNAVNYNAHVKATMSVLNDIFKNYKECTMEVKRLRAEAPQTENVAALTKALLARGQELQALKEEFKMLQSQKQDTEAMRAQCELYKTDFEGERAAREKMAAEKEYLHADLRAAQRNNQEMMLKASLFYHQLEEVRTRDPNLYRLITAKKTPANPARTPAERTVGSSSNATEVKFYTCPKCMVFKTVQYNMLEAHFDDCLDDY